MLPLVLVDLIEEYKYGIEFHERYKKVMGEFNFKNYIVKKRYKKMVKEMKGRGYLFPWPVDIDNDGWIEFIYSFDDRKIMFSYILTRAVEPIKIVISLQKNSFGVFSDHINLWFN